jgi:hypothetical protein
MPSAKFPELPSRRLTLGQPRGPELGQLAERPSFLKNEAPADGF